MARTEAIPADDVKVSIVIPSRERGVYLTQSLRTVTAIDDDAIEILVSDNASTDDTAERAAAVDDPRLRYVNTGARLSMRQNFEFALRQSTGDYIITFGDDDGMIPGQFPVLRRLLTQERPDAVSWELPTYGWPVPGFGGKTGGVRLRRSGMFGKPSRIDAKRRLAQLEAGLCDPEPPMPNLYHGCMSRAFLDRLAGPGAPYFRARSPDIYATFRALQHGGELWHIPHPLSINGFSPASTGGSMQSFGCATEKKADTRFLSEAKTDDVDDIVPVTKSMSLAYLGTLETARHLYPDQPVTPDYVPWYRRALLDAAGKDAATAAEIQASLDGHAAQFDAPEALAEARRLGPPQGKRHRDLLTRTLAKLHSLRRSAEIDGENTILTAARMCDTVLGADALAVMDGTLTPAQAWANARKRSRAFGTQL